MLYRRVPTMNHWLGPGDRHVSKPQSGGCVRLYPTRKGSIEYKIYIRGSAQLTHAVAVKQMTTCTKGTLALKNNLIKRKHMKLPLSTSVPTTTHTYCPLPLFICLSLFQDCCRYFQSFLVCHNCEICGCGLQSPMMANNAVF